MRYGGGLMPNIKIWSHAVVASPKIDLVNLINNY